MLRVGLYDATADGVRLVGVLSDPDLVAIAQERLAERRERAEREAPEPQAEDRCGG